MTSTGEETPLETRDSIEKLTEILTLAGAALSVIYVLQLMEWDEPIVSWVDRRAVRVREWWRRARGADRERLAWEAHEWLTYRKEET